MASCKHVWWLKIVPLDLTLHLSKALGPSTALVLTFHSINLWLFNFDFKVFGLANEAFSAICIYIPVNEKDHCYLNMFFNKVKPDLISIFAFLFIGLQFKDNQNIRLSYFFLSYLLVPVSNLFNETTNFRSHLIGF